MHFYICLCSIEIVLSSNTNNLGLSGNIYSSGFPRAYKASSSSCYHKITTSIGKETRIAFMDNDLNFYLCGSYDFVKIRGRHLIYSTNAIFALSDLSISLGNCYSLRQSNDWIVPHFFNYNFQMNSLVYAIYHIGFILSHPRPSLIFNKEFNWQQQFMAILAEGRQDPNFICKRQFHIK